MVSSAVATNHLFAKILERQKLLPLEVLDGLVTHARTLQEWLGQIAVDDGFLTYEEVALAIAQELNLTLVNLRTVTPDPKALEHLPVDTCRSHAVIPLNLDRGILYLAMANPLDDTAKMTIRNTTRCEISVQVASLNDIMRSIEEWYSDLKTQPDVDDITNMLSELQLPEEKSYDRPAAGHTPSHDSKDEIILEDLLMMMLENRASDLHLTAGSPPLMRVDGELRPLSLPVLSPTKVQNMIYAILTDIQITTFERHWELDFSYAMPGVSRFRVNVLRQRGSMGSVFRMIPVEVPTLDKLKMPPIIREMTEKPRGLVLVTGPTGSGKSTTLAAMIAEINRTKRHHIVTIEDPIEFLHNNKMSVITQREIGSDTESFTIALRHVLRQDPDVILIGEMRDLETISAALTAAETGHLVFATLHTTSAAQTIDRIIDVFPQHQQDQVRSMLANVLEGIVTQTLLPNRDGKGRSCAQEILIATPAIRSLIRENKVHQMPSVIQSGAKFGMMTLDQALRQLVLRGIVTLEEALKKSANPEDFKAMVAMQ